MVGYHFMYTLNQHLCNWSQYPTTLDLHTKTCYIFNIRAYNYTRKFSKLEPNINRQIKCIFIAQ